MKSKKLSENILKAVKSRGYKYIELDAVIDADQILVLESSGIVERGHHADLLERGGPYAGMWRRQEASVEAH